MVVVWCLYDVYMIALWCLYDGYMMSISCLYDSYMMSIWCLYDIDLCNVWRASKYRQKALWTSTNFDDSASSKNASGSHLDAIYGRSSHSSHEKLGFAQTSIYVTFGEPRSIAKRHYELRLILMILQARKTRLARIWTRSMGARPIPRMRSSVSRKPRFM